MQGYESWLRVRGQAWGQNMTFDFGYYLDCEAIALNIGQELNERDNRVVFGRNSKPSSRSYGNLNPNGNVTIFPRTDDIIPILKAHFQCWQFDGTIITSAGSIWAGTGTFIFVPTPNRPNFTGSAVAFGTMFGGSYNAATKGDVYTVKVDHKWGDSVTGSNGISFYQGVVGDLEFQQDAGDDLKLIPNFQFGSVDYRANFTAAHNPSSGFGSYSTKNRLIGISGTLTYTYAGVATTLDITNQRITSPGNVTPINRIGLSTPAKFSYGRNAVTGEFTLPWDNSDFLYIFKNDGSAALTLEYKNANNDHLKIDLPLIKYAPFQPNVDAGDSEVNTAIPFRAYMSEDGGTPGIKLTLYAIWRQSGSIY